MLDERTTAKPDDYIVRDPFMLGNNNIVQFEKFIQVLVSIAI